MYRIQSKTLGDIIDETAEQLGENRKEVNEVIRYAWREVFDSISGLENREIYLKNLGVFAVKTTEETLDNYIREKILNYIKAKGIASTRSSLPIYKDNYKWITEDYIKNLREEIYKLLQFRRHSKQRRALKLKRKYKTMILIPLESLNLESIPSTTYQREIERVMELVRRVKDKHFKLFPENEETLKQTLEDGLNSSVMLCFNSRKEDPIDTGIVTIISSMYKKDGCIETTFLLNI